VIKPQIYPWLQEQWHDLLQRNQTSGLPHAMLMAGQAGLGKHDLAAATAKRLLCQRPETDQDGLQQACSQCHSCQLFEAGTHPDFLVCQHEAKGKQIKIDAIRQVNDFLSKTPQIAASKVVQIYPLEAMNVNAANALLKTLEEPAGNSYLILLAERMGSVLPTIKSRTQKIQITLPTKQQATDWLSQQTWDGKEDGLSPDQKQGMIALSLDLNANAPLKALEWLSTEAADENLVLFNTMHDWLSAQKDLGSIAKQLVKMELEVLLAWWTTLSLDLLKAQMHASDHLAHKNQQDWLQQLAERANKVKLFALQEKLREVSGRLAAAQGNYNHQLLVESLLLDWRDIIQ